MSIEKLDRRAFLRCIATCTGAVSFTRCKNQQSPSGEFQKIKQKLFGERTLSHLVLPQTTVGLVQAEQGHAEEMDYLDIRDLVWEAIEYAGGFDSLISNHDSVVLKPNIMCLWINSTGQKLTPNVNGVTTDWRVTRAVVEMVRRYNPDGKVYIMESSAFQCTGLAMLELQYTHEDIPGVDAFLAFEDHSGRYEEWNAEALQRVILPKDKALYPNSMKPNKSAAFYLNKLYHNADVIISLPVLKNHTHTGITGAIKNVGIGSSPPTIYGKLLDKKLVTAATKKVLSQFSGRLQVNRWYKINHAPGYLDKWIHDYYLCKPVHFVVTDGLNGLQNGPDISKITKQKNLTDNLMNMRLILAGKDAIAVDTIHALLIGMDPTKIDHLSFLSQSGVGCTDPALIEVKGKMVHQVKRQFEMNAERAAEKLSVTTGSPQMSITSAEIRDEKLYVKLAVNPKQICKVTIHINGQALQPVITGNYQNIILDTHFKKSKRNCIDIFAFDEFLNCNHQQKVLA